MDGLDPPGVAVRPVKLTSGDIQRAMAKKWAAPEYALMWEVALATGAVSNNRYADAVLMSLWPSRGLELHGVEIKVSRSDWRREAADPSKAEAIAAYCDRWWVHTPPGVVADLAELPPAWGLREYDGRAWRTVREAAQTDAKPMDRTFLASLLRRADGAERARINEEARRITSDREAALQAARDDIEKRVEAEVERRTKRLSDVEKSVREFEEATGLSLSHGRYGGPTGKELGALVKAVEAAGIGKTYGGVSHLSDQMRRAADRIDEAVASLNLSIGQHPMEAKGG